MNLKDAITQAKAQIEAGRRYVIVDAEGFHVIAQLTDAWNTRRRSVRVDVYAGGKRLTKAQVAEHVV
jgi:hypothetical protein